MPINADFMLGSTEAGVLTVTMTPPVAVGGWTVEFRLQKYFGFEDAGSGLVNKYLASGYNGVSGISVTNSGQGIFAITLNAIDSSGLQYGNYAYAVLRTDSGQQTILSQGYELLTPSVG